jgi:multicomponent K+:H+ antiporter subunit G
MMAIDLSVLIEALVSAMVLAGAAFTLLGSIGLLRMKDVFQRMHAPTKATTLGVGLILLAASIASSLDAQTLSLHQILIGILLFVTAPVSAWMIARVALHQGLAAPDAFPEVLRGAVPADAAQTDARPH